MSEDISKGSDNEAMEPTYERCENGHIDPDTKTGSDGVKRCLVIFPSSSTASPFEGNCAAMVREVPIDQAWHDAYSEEDD